MTNIDYLVAHEGLQYITDTLNRYKGILEQIDPMDKEAFEEEACLRIQSKVSIMTVIQGLLRKRIKELENTE